MTKTYELIDDRRIMADVDENQHTATVSVYALDGLVETVNKTGQWISWYVQKEREGYTENIPHCKCSECNREYDPYIASLFNYCPNCGAKMVEPQESEDKE